MREMKDSGIEWVGQIPKDWDVVPHKRVMHKVKKICEQYSGEDIISLTMNGVIKRDLTAGGKMPTSFDGYQYVKPNDLLLCLFDIDVTPRCVGVVKDYGVTSPAYSRFVMHDGYYNAYYDYLLRAIDDDKVFVHLSKNLRSSLTESDFGAIKTCVPSLAEQKRIVTFLDAQCAEIDTVLEKTRASIEEYKKLKQAVITQAVTKGIFDKQIYPHNVKLKYLLYIASGDAIRNEELSEVGKYPAYGGGESLGFASKYNTLENSLIVGRVGARCGCVTYIDSKAWATDNALIVHPICNPRYMYYMLIYSQLNNLNTSNAQPLITATKIKNVVVPYFLEDICQKKIVDFLDEKCACIDAIIEKKQQYLTEIENYKKSLIYEYVTGKKEVV